MLNLREFVESNKLNKKEEQGLVKAFEITYELAWKTIKDFYEYQGEAGFQGAKDTFRMAFNRELIENGELWMQMINDRNNTVHLYNEEIAREIINNVLQNYYNEFLKLEEVLEKRSD